jgi:hypothetical protein
MHGAVQKPLPRYPQSPHPREPPPQGPPAQQPSKPPVYAQQASYGQAHGYPQQPPYGQAPSYGQPAAQPPAPQGQRPPQAPYGAPAGYPQQPAYGQGAQPAPPHSLPPAYDPHAPYTPGSYPLASATGMGTGKPVGLLLTEAFELYRRHLGVLLATSAILIVPLSLAKSVVLSLVLAPAVVAVVVVGAGFMATLIGLLATLFGLAMMYGIAVPLVMGALTIVVADRATGGSAGPAQAYALLWRRLGTFLSAWIPAFLVVLVGMCLLFVPGLIAGFLFMFIAPVVLIENVGGIEALKRSANLVMANLPQVGVVYLAFAVLQVVASTVAHVFIPRTAYFFDSFIQDALLVFLLPVPIVGTVLLYLDVRRQTDGLDPAAIRASLEALRG